MKKSKLAALVMVLLVTAAIVYWIYDAEYHYPNTEAGRLAVVEDYVLSAEDDMEHDLKIGTPVEVLAWKTFEDRLYIFYCADNKYNVHGIVELQRGWNGKYMPLKADMDPAQFSAGIYYSQFFSKDNDALYSMLAGKYDENIAYVDVEYAVTNYHDLKQEPITKRYTFTENFLEVWTSKTMIEDIGFQFVDRILFWVEDMRIYDAQGNEITEQYQDKSIERSWAGTRTTAESFAVYLAIGLVAFAGILIALFIWEEWK